MKIKTIVYESRTGKVEAFVDKVKAECKRRNWVYTFVKLTETNLPNFEKPYHLITYTDGFGIVPELTDSFVRAGTNPAMIASVSSSGSKSWGSHQYGVARDLIAMHFKCSVGLKFELAGLPKDVDEYIELLRKHREIPAIELEHYFLARLSSQKRYLEGLDNV